MIGNPRRASESQNISGYLSTDLVLKYFLILAGTDLVLQQDLVNPMFLSPEQGLREHLSTFLNFKVPRNYPI